MCLWSKILALKYTEWAPCGYISMQTTLIMPFFYLIILFIKHYFILYLMVKSEIILCFSHWIGFFIFIMIYIFRAQLRFSYSVCYFQKLKNMYWYTGGKMPLRESVMLSVKKTVPKIAFYALKSIFGKACLSFFGLK